MIVTSVYLKLSTDKSGEIRGPSIQKGKEGLIPVLGLNHNLRVPLDMATGLPSGKRQHHPIIITKEVDQTSPRLAHILATNDKIKEAILTFYGPAGLSSSNLGAEQKLYTMTLKRGLISEIQVSLKSMIELKNQPGNFIENIYLVYNEIEWKWEMPSFSAVDQWGSPA